MNWKVSQYNNVNKRASDVWKGKERNLVLAPGDLWETSLKEKIDDSVKEKLGDNKFRCEQANVTISVKNSRGQGFKEEYVNTPIEWNNVNNHLAGLGSLFGKGRQITIDIDLAYREIVSEAAPTERRSKKRKVTDAQRDQLAAEAAIYGDVYKALRCDARNCKSGPHCAVDAQGKHLELIPFHIEKIVRYVQNGGTFEGPRDLPLEIWQTLYKDAAAKAASRPGNSASNAPALTAGPSTRAEAQAAPGLVPLSPVSFQGKWDDLLRQYDAYLADQVECSNWQKALKNAGMVARKLFLELSFSYANEKFTSNKLIAEGVPPPIAGQWVRTIKKFYRSKKAECIEAQSQAADSPVQE